MSRLSAYSSSTQICDPDKVVNETLHAVRMHLDMQVAYVAEISGNKFAIRYISKTPEFDGTLRLGVTRPFVETLCSLVLSEQVPNLIPDTARFAALHHLPVFQENRIGAFVCIPMYLDDGSLYGALTCFSHQPMPSLNARDREVVELFADLSRNAINKKITDAKDQLFLETQMDDAIHQDGLQIYLQPIVSLSNHTVRAVEALSRFNTPGGKSVEWWFAQAHRANMQVALEVAAIEKALDILPDIPHPVYLTVNVSPATIAAPAFMMALRHAPPNRLIVELTEHQEIAATADLMRTLDLLRRRGIGIAIDDVGAGYAGLSTILQLKPNVMKLDRSLVMDIHKDTAKQSLTSALVYFATQENAFLIAEGVEKLEEHDTLRNLGVRLGQGFLYARPGPAHDQIALMDSRRKSKIIRFPLQAVN